MTTSTLGIDPTSAAGLNTGKKVVLCVNTAWNIVNFRSGLVRALLSAGYEVVSVAPPDDHVDAVRALGTRYVEYEMSRKGCNPLAEFVTFFRLFTLLRRERPDAFLGYTIKPNIYGAIACRLLGIPVINNVAGLGTAFAPGSWLTPVARRLYRLAFQRSHRVFFQNDDDREAFMTAGIVHKQQSLRLPGSGIDLQQFSLRPLPPVGPQAPFRFLLVARLLWDKGVGEYVEAARQLRAAGMNVECHVLGFIDDGNPRAIPRRQVEQWHEEGAIRYLGTTRDVKPILESCHCVVLPSFYREGVPRSLLEAAALGRPLITTDSIGCRETVDDGISGHLVEPRSATHLAAKMRDLASTSIEEVAEMGRRAREKMERQFDERLVTKAYLQELQTLAS